MGRSAGASLTFKPLIEYDFAAIADLFNHGFEGCVVPVQPKTLSIRNVS